MTYPTVKSSEYGKQPRPKYSHIWTDTVWRRLVRAALLELTPEFRAEVARTCSFRFSKGELEL